MMLRQQLPLAMTPCPSCIPPASFPSVPGGTPVTPNTMSVAQKLKTGLRQLSQLQCRQMPR